jgi:hypothetical protein
MNVLVCYGEVGIFRINTLNGGPVDFSVQTITPAGAVDASAVTYTPGAPGNWSPIPTVVSGALDTLAAKTLFGIPYTPTVPGNWSPVPTNGGAAVDQLAARNAFTTAYTPTVPGNWSPAPTTVGGGLDQLATHPYTPVVPGNWSPVPSSTWTGLDQLAARTAAALVYAPAVPGNWSPSPTLVGPALDQLATRPTTATALPFTPSVPGNWSPAPTTTAGGLDQLAARTTPTATGIGYTVGTATDWFTTAPTTVAAALDALALTSRAGQEANVAVVGPSDPIKFTTAAVQPVASGKYLVIGTVSADASGASTQVINLYADATVIATGKSGTGGAGPFNGTLVAFVTLSRAATHTFAIEADASAGTNTANAGWMKLMWLEIGG